MISGSVDTIIDGDWETRNVEVKFVPNSTTEVHVSFTDDDSDLYVDFNFVVVPYFYLL
jgi:hypothetical protein